MRCVCDLAKTQFEIVVEYFCRIEVGHRKFLLSKEERDKNVDLE